MTEDKSDRYVVVGVTPKQPPAVIRQAARFAREFQAVLVCANVEAGSYVVAEHPDGSVESRPIDPDQPDWNTAVFDGGLANEIRTLAQAEGIRVEFRELAGDIAHALGRLAEVLDAEMIIVGSRRGGLRSSMHEFFGIRRCAPRAPPAATGCGRTATGIRARPSPLRRAALMTGSQPRRRLNPDLQPVQDQQHRPRPVHLSWANIGLVAVGGAIGTGLRYLITTLVPKWAGAGGHARHQRGRRLPARRIA